MSDSSGWRPTRPFPGDDESSGVPPLDVSTQQLTMGLCVLAVFAVAATAQLLKLALRRSHVGLALLTPVLLALSTLFALLAFLAVQLDNTVVYCEQLTPWDCVAALLPVIQIASVLLLAHLQIVAHLCSFDLVWLEEHYYDTEKAWRTARIVVGTAVATELVFSLVFIILWFSAAQDVQLGAFASTCTVMAALGFGLHMIPQVHASYQLKAVGSVSVPGAALLAIAYAGFSVYAGLFYSWYVYVPIVVSAAGALANCMLLLWYLCSRRKDTGLLVRQDMAADEGEDSTSEHDYFLHSPRAIN